MKKTFILNCNNTSQYYCFYNICDQGFVSARDFKNITKSYNIKLGA